jgi:hypothetical protein
LFGNDLRPGDLARMDEHVAPSAGGKKGASSKSKSTTKDAVKSLDGVIYKVHILLIKLSSIRLVQRFQRLASCLPFLRLLMMMHLTFRKDVACDSSNLYFFSAITELVPE